MLNVKVKQWFEEGVRLNLEAPQELKDTLLRGHPRLQGFIDRMTAELLNAEKVCRERGVFLKEKTMQDTVYDMTKVFMQGMEGEAKRRYESDLQRLAREAEQSKIQEFEDVLDGKATGEFAEAGVITNEEIDSQREKALEQKARIEGRSF